MTERAWSDLTNCTLWHEVGVEIPYSASRVKQAGVKEKCCQLHHGCQVQSPPRISEKEGDL
jgi:hypothetical protein